MNQSPILTVFTDGASKGNPGPGGWGAIVLRPDGHVTELGGGSPHTTNNKMELTGAIEAFRAVEPHAGRVAVYTDSTYVIQGIREWIHGWKRRGWKTAGGTDVLNRELWEELDALTSARGPRRTEWHYVRGHVGTPGNERVDEIADAFATNVPVTLYDGPLADYAVPIQEIPGDTRLPSRNNAGSRNGGPTAARSKSSAYSYVSVVGGTPMRHATWAECERRVKGQPGALYRKATSPADEAAILRSWHIDPNDV